MLPDGYIQLHRKITKWEWYEDGNTARVFFHCLLMANHKDNPYQGMIIKRGSFRTGRKKLAVELGLTEQQIRTALNKLKSTNEITIKTYAKFSIITVNNWNNYQQNIKKSASKITDEQPTNNQQITTNNNDNNDNNDNKYNSCDFLQKSQVEKSSSKVSKKFVKPSVEEIKNYCIETKRNIDAQEFYDFYESKNWMIGKNKMQKWKSAVSLWDRRKNKTQQSQQNSYVPQYSEEIED